MTTLLILVYTLTLAYLASTIRVKRFITLLTIQGSILFCIAVVHLQHIEWFHLLFIVIETLLVKAIGIPLFLNRVRKRNHLQRLSRPQVRPFFAVLIVTAGIVGSFILGQLIHDDHLQTHFFSVGIASVLTGFFLIIAHRSVFDHLIGYLVIENGIFLISLSVAAEMPMLVNTAILLDIVVGVLALGLFLNRVGDQFDKVEAEHLSKLKD